jgi:hypothetical protein
MDGINIQLRLTGAHQKAFERFKDREVVGEARKNTDALKRLIETTPEWQEIVDERRA